MSEVIKTPPTGRVTLMFTDIEDSTPLWKQYPDAFLLALERHNTLIVEELAAFDGYKVSMTGDGLLLAFSEPVSAARFAAHLQDCFLRETWPMLNPGDRISIRIGIHTGEPQYSHANYLGLSVHRARRICDAGHGGQILLSEDVCRELNAAAPGVFSLRNLGLYRLKGLDAPEHLFQLVTDTQQIAFPPLRASALSLPPERGDFIGRTDVLVEVEALLSDPANRLVTLTGMGGMGKTRTALRLAHHLTPRSTSGIYFAELAPLTDSASVISYLLNVFCLTVAPDASPLEAICGHLREQPAILILDNLEHLEGIETIVFQLLNGCPKLQILATSRIGLSLWMQREVSLPPLPVPDPDASFAQILEAESVQLFARRAQGIERGFALTPENAGDVAEICRIVAGIPLGIELAAQKLRMHTPDAIVARLQHQLLDVMSRTPELPKRQWCLRSVFEWSDNLLPSTARSVLERLPIFRGSFSLDAVEGVCTDEAVQDVAEELEHLLNHSWVEKLADDAGRRFRLLSPVAEYVLDTYGAPPESLCLAHARYFEAQAQQIEQLFRSGAVMPACARLRSDLENFRAALRWACNAEAHDLAAAIGVSLGVVLMEAGQWEECTAWLGLAARSASILGRFPLLSQIATLQGIMAERKGELQVAYDYQAQALSYAQEAGDNRGVLRAHINLANLARATHDLPACARHAHEILRYAPLCDMGGSAGLGYMNLAAISEQEGRFEEAEAYWQKAFRGYAEENDVWSIAHWEFERGRSREAAGDLDAAMRYYTASFPRWHSLGYEQQMAVNLCHIARVALRQDNYGACAQFLLSASRLSANHHGELQVMKEVTQMLRAEIGEERMQRMLEEGQFLSIEEMLAQIGRADMLSPGPGKTTAVCSEPRRPYGARENAGIKET